MLLPESDASSSPPTILERFFPEKLPDRRRPRGSAVAPLLSINGLPMARLFCFRVQRRLHGSIRSPKQHTRLFLERSEEHTSELQSLRHLVCRLLLEKKNNY